MAKSLTNRVIAPEIVRSPEQDVLNYEANIQRHVLPNRVWTDVRWTAFIHTKHGRHDVERQVSLDKVIARAKQMGRKPVYVSA